MNCIKCGREMKELHVFCDGCLAGMARYPVKPTVTVQLPPRQPEVPVKKRVSRKPAIKPEEQIRRLRSTLRWTYVALAAALAAFVLTTVLLLGLLEQPSDLPADKGFGREGTAQQSDRP